MSVERAESSLSTQVDVSFVTVQGHRLEVRRIPGIDPDAPTLVFLHEGLGPVSMWPDFPDKTVCATGCPAIVFSRYGYRLPGVLRRGVGVDYMHVQALVVLPALPEP